MLRPFHNFGPIRCVAPTQESSLESSLRARSVLKSLVLSMEGEPEVRNDPQDGENKDKEGQSMTISTIEHTEKRLENSMMPQFDTLDGSFHFTLAGYSLAKGVGSGKHFSSGIFVVGGHDWAVYFYPDGKNADDHSEFVSVFIALASDSSNVQALFEIVLLDQSGNGKHKIHSHFHRPIDSPYTLKDQGCMWGYKRYFQREALEKSNFLRNDTLRFTGRVGVLRSSIKPTKLSTTRISPISQQSTTPHHQSTGAHESSPQNMQVTGSQSEDAIVSEVKGLRLEDELVKYHHKHTSIQSPIRQ